MGYYKIYKQKRKPSLFWFYVLLIILITTIIYNDVITPDSGNNPWQHSNSTVFIP
jgi:hypothetical protein